MTRTHALFALLAGTLCAGTAAAVDGVLEINQTCAVQTGCFPADTPGLPVTITSATPGTSFRLTSDLVVRDTNPGGIAIYGVHDISIDLNQFSIIRAACVANDSSCTPTSGSADGIEHQNAGSYAGTSVRNGSVVGMGRYGLQLGTGSEVVGVRTRWNRLDGILALGTVLDSVAFENGGNGIFIGDGVARGNIARANGGLGIFAFGGVVGDNVAVANAGDGIHALGGAVVENNSTYLNTGFGLRLESDTGYHANVVHDNTAGTVTGGANLGSNLCNGGACP